MSLKSCTISNLRAIYLSGWSGWMDVRGVLTSLYAPCHRTFLVSAACSLAGRIAVCNSPDPQQSNVAPINATPDAKFSQSASICMHIVSDPRRTRECHEKDFEKKS
eukprot:1923590-Amphidinium_carterae.1